MIIKQFGHQGDTQWFSLSEIPNDAIKVEKQFIAASERSNSFHALFGDYDNVLYTFELKKREGLKMSPKQKLFADQVRKQGGKSYLITDFENFKNIFEKIVNN